MESSNKLGLICNFELLGNSGAKETTNTSSALLSGPSSDDGLSRPMVLATPVVKPIIPRALPSLADGWADRLQFSNTTQTGCEVAHLVNIWVSVGHSIPI